MRETMAQAAARGVQVGAHPSYPDPANVGRRVVPMTTREVTETVARQVGTLCALASADSVRVIRRERDATG